MYNWSKQLELLFIVAIILLLLVYSGLLIHKLFQTYHHQSPVFDPPATLPNKSNYSSKNIIDKNLFGQNKIDVKSSNIFPLTDRQLQLRGAFTASDPQLASAIIEGADGQARHYKVGMDIEGGLKLHSVLSDSVLLLNRGNLERLYFPTVDIVDQKKNSSTTETITTESSQEQSKSISSKEKQQLIRMRLEELRKQSTR